MYTFLRLSSILSFLTFFGCLTLLFWAYQTHNRSVLLPFVLGAGLALVVGFALSRVADK